MLPKNVVISCSLVAIAFDMSSCPWFFGQVLPQMFPSVPSLKVVELREVGVET